jgi:hypothetical protein
MPTSRDIKGSRRALFCSVDAPSLIGNLFQVSFQCPFYLYLFEIICWAIQSLMLSLLREDKTLMVIQRGSAIMKGSCLMVCAVWADIGEHARTHFVCALSVKR